MLPEVPSFLTESDDDGNDLLHRHLIMAQLWIEWSSVESIWLCKAAKAVASFRVSSWVAIGQHHLR